MGLLIRQHAIQIDTHNSIEVRGKKRFKYQPLFLEDDSELQRVMHAYYVRRLYVFTMNRCACIRILDTGDEQRYSHCLSYIRCLIYRSEISLSFRRIGLFENMRRRALEDV